MLSAVRISTLDKIVSSKNDAFYSFKRNGAIDWHTLGGSFFFDQIALITFIARSLPVTHELYVKVLPTMLMVNRFHSIKI